MISGTIALAFTAGMVETFNGCVRIPRRARVNGGISVPLTATSEEPTTPS